MGAKISSSVHVGVRGGSGLITTTTTTAAATTTAAPATSLCGRATVAVDVGRSGSTAGAVPGYYHNYYTTTTPSKTETASRQHDYVGAPQLPAHHGSRYRYQHRPGDVDTHTSMAAEPYTNLLAYGHGHGHGQWWAWAPFDCQWQSNEW